MWLWYNNYDDDDDDDDDEKFHDSVQSVKTVIVDCFCFSLVSYSLMMDCWKQNPDERPSFQELVKNLERMMLQEVEYLDFELLDETKDYYQVAESKTGESDDEEVSQLSGTPNDDFFQ